MENQRRRAELRRKVENAVRKGRRVERDEGTPGPKTPQVPRPAGAPYWLPVGPFWDRLAEGVRRAVGEILEPAYRRLVVEARDELERSAGMTLVHLMWLEICDQSHLGDTVGDWQAIYSGVRNARTAPWP